MTLIEEIIGVLVMRQGDRLPLLSIQIIDEEHLPLDITAATSTSILIRPQDGQPPVMGMEEEFGNTWLELPAFPADPDSGIVTYDWGNEITEMLSVGDYDITVVVHWADGTTTTAPSDTSAQLIVRPPVLAAVPTWDNPQALWDVATWSDDRWES